MLDLLGFCSLELNANIRFRCLLQLQDLDILILVVDKQLQQFDYSPGVELLGVSLIATHPFLKLLLEVSPSRFWGNSEDFCLGNCFDGSDRVDELQNERSPSFEHADVDILPASGVKPYLNVLFLLAGEEKLEDAILYLLLEAALCEFFAVDQPRSLREIPREFDIPPAKVDIAGEQG